MATGIVKRIGFICECVASAANIGTRVVVVDVLLVSSVMKEVLRQMMSIITGTGNSVREERAAASH